MPDDLEDRWAQAGATAGLAAARVVSILADTAWTISSPLIWAFQEADARYARRQLDRLCRHAANISDVARQTNPSS